MNHAILLISCPDQRGITATVTNFIFTHNGNIVHADQHIDEQSNTFFMRVEWSLEEFSLKDIQIGQHFMPIAGKFGMKWELYFTEKLPRVAVFVSKHLHCLYDLLSRWKAGHFACEISLIVSNHPDAQTVAKEFGIPFFEFIVLPESRDEQEKKQISLLKNAHVDLVVLARYHQVLTASFVREFQNRIINIHHSFLPAFAGKNPYAQAYERGVKIIGATSHFVTEQLDEGPIIEQDTVRVSHRDSLQDLVRKGEDLEKIVLSRTIRLSLEHKILSYGNKTVVFD
jgi:formyltetrahydrofolate deformylase